MFETGHLKIDHSPRPAGDSLISGFKYRDFFINYLKLIDYLNHKNTIRNYPRAQQNHRDNHMACSKVKKLNLKKNDFSRLKQTETQQILVNKFMRESIVAVSKLNTKYAVMLIYASYCLSAVEANDKNQTDPNSQSNSQDKSILDNVGTIVSIVVGILGFMTAVLTFYCQHMKRKEEPTSWSFEQVDKMIEYLSKFSKDAKDIKHFEDLQNLKNKVEKIENDQNLRKRPQSENLRNKV